MKTHRLLRCCNFLWGVCKAKLSNDERNEYDRIRKEEEFVKSIKSFTQNKKGHALATISWSIIFGEWINNRYHLFYSRNY